MYLFFDTETTGVPRDWKAPISDLGNWPRVVQLAWAVVDRHEHEVDRGTYLIKPQGFTIPRGAERIHGISTERTLGEGYPLREVLTKFSAALSRATVVIAHNLDFDEKVVGAEFLREGMPVALHQKRRVCTMMAGTDFCKLPGPYGYKWPSLPELHAALFQSPYEESHDAAADVAACAKCFFALGRKGIIDLMLWRPAGDRATSCHPAEGHLDMPGRAGTTKGTSDEA